MIVLLPVYKPGKHLPELVEELRGAESAAQVVVVDDGSGAEADGVLEAAAGLGCTVLRHPTNRGKGAAIKTALTCVTGIDATTAQNIAMRVGERDAWPLQEAAEGWRPWRALAATHLMANVS